jgi:hypothetical protein
MAVEHSRSQEQIFADMFRELRAWNQEISSSPERMDPILRMLLQLYAHQLHQIDKRVDHVWDIATSSLVRSVCPEAGRWPIPAHTVIKCDLADPVVEIDPHTRLYYKEQREGGRAFFFTSQRVEKLASATVERILLDIDGRIVPLYDPTATGSRVSSGMPEQLSAAGARRIYVAIRWSGQVHDLVGTALFLRGSKEALGQLKWARWSPIASSGEPVTEGAFCPGLQDTIERMFSANGQHPREWGGFRTSTNIFGDLVDSFVLLPEPFVSVLKPISGDSPLLKKLNLTAAGLTPAAGNLYLLSLDLPERGDRQTLLKGVNVDFGCFIASNRNELTIFKHTAGNRLVDIELPESISGILAITEVTDSRKREYRPRHDARQVSIDLTYTLEERDDHLILWFDFSSVLTAPPESITVRYAVTEGTSANGIEAGLIADLYESHPGIVKCRNLTNAVGAIPAKSDQQILAEVSTRIRGRDRALTFADIKNWTLTFDPRIREIECESGVQKSPHGVRRCVVVGIHVREADFYSDEELELLRRRVHSFLTARSSINANYEVEILRR